MAKIEVYFLILGSIFLDILIGDPKFLLHPVQVIGFSINKVSKFLLRYLNGKNSHILGGFLIFLIIVGFSYISGKYLELQFYQSDKSFYYGIVILLGISSCLATKSLISSVKEIPKLIREKNIDEKAKEIIIKKVQNLVSREVDDSISDEALLRYATESLTENSVDGIFGPLFWILIGAFCIQHSIYLPGPLSLGFSYKAISTLDSMIGYKYIPFKNLGYFSAKIEDLVTFLPCRLVVLTLPLVSNKIGNYFSLVEKAFNDGSKYESPNSGLSESIFAFIADIQLGGKNKYRNNIIFKPLLNKGGTNSDINSIDKICKLILRLQFLWITIFSLIFFLI